MCFSKKREVVPDLPPMLWHSFGTVAALLQEIVNVYPAINPPHLTVSINNNSAICDYSAESVEQNQPEHACSLILHCTLLCSVINFYQ